MAKSKKKEEDVSEELDAISEEGQGYDETAYLPVFNKETKLYEMFLIRVDTVNKKAFVEVEKTRYSTEMRAHHDMLTRMANDSKIKNKKQRNQK